MNFILQEQKIDLGDTAVENIFITDYMPSADGAYVKIYLLGYKYACDKEELDKFNNETIAKNLKMPLSDVLNAWDFWEREGIVIKHCTDDEYNYTVEFVNLKQLYIDNIYKYIKNQDNEPKHQAIDEKQENDINKKVDSKKMLQEIEMIYGEPMKIREKQKILSWLNSYNINQEIMVQAFSYCINNKGIRKLSYIEAVVSTWSSEGVCDLDTLSEYLEKRNDRSFIYTRISKALGFANRSLTEGEMKIINKWVDDWGFSMEMLLKCLENSTRISNPNLNYFDSILDKWHQKGYKTIEDLKDDKKPEEKLKVKATVQTVQTAQTKNKFHNFDQKIKNYSEEQLAQIGRKNFERKLKELGLNNQSEEDK